MNYFVFNYTNKNGEDKELRLRLGYRLGNVKIYGEYYTEDSEFETNNGLKEFENIIPFEVVFSKEDPIIDEIYIKNFEIWKKKVFFGG